MLTDYSLPIWGLPYFDFLQFPWRFLNLVGLFGCIILGYLIWQLKEDFSEKIVFVISILIILITIGMNFKLFNPKEILDRNANYYTNGAYLSWTAPKISDEYLPKGFVTPKDQQEINGSFDKLKIENGSLFKEMHDSGRVIFEQKQTSIEQVSNILTLLGAGILIAVIIGKLEILYGKKTS